MMPKWVSCAPHVRYRTCCVPPINTVWSFGDWWIIRRVITITRRFLWCLLWCFPGSRCHRNDYRTANTIFIIMYRVFDLNWKIKLTYNIKRRISCYDRSTVTLQTSLWPALLVPIIISCGDLCCMWAGYLVHSELGSKVLWCNRNSLAISRA